jgi:hypothetical protein
MRGRGPGGRGGRGPAQAQFPVAPLPEGVAPKRINWKPFTAAAVKTTIFNDFKESDYESVKVDFDLITEHFCQSKDT